MKAKINIEIWDDTTQAEIIAAGITNENLKRLYEMAFRNVLDATRDGCEYSINVEITE